MALIGAHTLGRAHLNASGYINQWNPASSTLSNEFFIDLMNQDEGWNQVTIPGSGKKQWVTGEGTELMLNVDMALWIDFDDYLDLNDNGAVSCSFVEDVDDMDICPRQNATADIVEEYADDNLLWLQEFADVFQKMTFTGYDVENDENFYMVESIA